ncbi:MAG: hypothetical protein DHS20C21_20490 [Gemmatimonadota bacterium]|nr:MAG: hypothetical protein DHS20C21_20490 [Gemmatimonadota bacterium]
MIRSKTHHRLAPLRCFGAVLPLLLAACQGSPGKLSGDVPSAEPSRVLAEIDGARITEADVDARLAELPALARPEYSSPIGKERLLRQIVEEELLYRAATQEKLDREPEVAALLERSRRQLLTQAYLDRMQRQAQDVSDKEARAFYKAHEDEYRIERTLRVRILNNTDRNTVERAREMATDESIPFTALCSKFNEKPLLIKAGGLLPNWVRKGKAVAWLGNTPEFHEAVFALKVGELSEVFETIHGFNVAMVEEEREERQRTFEEARPDVVGRIARERSSRGLPELLDELKDRYQVKMLAEPSRSAEEMFTAAQLAPTPARKVELFEELVERYPEDEHVLEALFMIGFTRSEELADAEGARVALERVIRDFPESELAQSARWMLSSEGVQTPVFEDDESAAPAQE